MCPLPVWGKNVIPAIALVAAFQVRQVPLQWQGVGTSLADLVSGCRSARTGCHRKFYRKLEIPWLLRVFWKIPPKNFAVASFCETGQSKQA